MIQIHSRVYGLLEVKEEQIYSFEPGILGLADIKEYAVLSMAGTPFYVMHALKSDVNFVLLPSHEVLDQYSFHIPKEITTLMELSSPEEVGVMLIVNVQPDELFVNLMAPVLLAPHSRRGCQYVIKDQEFPIRYPLQLAKGGA